MFMRRCVLTALLLLTNAAYAVLLEGNEYYFGHQHASGYSGLSVSVGHNPEYANSYFSVDAEDMQIQVTFTARTTFQAAAKRPFNGFILGSSMPLGFSFSLASSTLPGFDVSRISFGASDNEPYALMLNFAGLTVSAGQEITVTLAPVPEPETYALLIVGLAAVHLMARRSGRLSA